MRRNRGWAALRTALTAVALGGLMTATGSSALAASSASTTVDTAAGIKNTFSYSTSGQIDPNTGVSGEGVTGINVISFDSVPLDSQGKAGNSFVTPTSFSLGSFRVSPLPEGQSTTYTNTPFSITFLPQSVNGDPISGATPVVLKGLLNGTVTGSGQSDVIATFTPQGSTTDPNNDPFAFGFKTETGNSTYANTLRILSDKVALVPSTSNGGLTTVQGQVLSTASPIPEPTTIALFLTAAAGLGLRQRLRRKAG